jgi:hypothetical protein
MNNVQTDTNVGGTPLDVTHKSNMYGQMLARVWEIANSKKGALPTGFGVREGVHPVIPIADGHTKDTVMEMTKAEAQACIQVAYKLACEANLVSKEGAEHSLAGDSIPEILSITYPCTYKGETTIVSLFGHCLKGQMASLKSAHDKAVEAERVANNPVTYMGKDSKGNDVEFSSMKKAVNSLARWIHKTEFPTVAGAWYDHPGHKGQLIALAQERLVIRNKGAEAEAPAPVTETTTPTIMDFSTPAPAAPVQESATFGAVDKAVVAQYVAAGMSPADAVAAARAEANL